MRPKSNFNWYQNINPNQPGLFWMLSSPGGGGGLSSSPPPSDLGRGSSDGRKNLHKGRVRCKLQDCIVRLFFIVIFYFIWIMLIYAKKSYFYYNSLIKASRLLIFGTYILFNILSNSALKNFSIKINFLCILLCYEFLIYMYFSVFSTYCFLLFFRWNLLRPLLKHYLAKIN